jgi:tRNA threonylcarbamoyl adenosine modification protein YeaZ
VTSIETTLAIVTCGPLLEVALTRPRQSVPSLVRLAGGAPRSRLLLAAVDLVVEDSGTERSAIDRVVVTRGPGSFTGIRAGLATVAGFAAAIDVEIVAYDSLTTQAARCLEPGSVWAAQPGRRGEVYAQRFRVVPDSCPRSDSEIEIVPVSDTWRRGPWVAAEAIALPPASRVCAVRSAAEALLYLVTVGVASQPIEPMYVEGPPIHVKRSDG